MIHKRITFGSVILVCMGLLFSCKGSADTTASPQNDNQPVKIKYLALGDSYTKGESVAQSQSFPYQLQAALATNNYEVEQLNVIAETGWTTANLLSAIKSTNLNDTFDIVTLLIGVNNQYQKIPIATYEDEFLKLLQKAIGFAGNDKSKVIVLSIPDYGATPFGQGSAAIIGKQIDQYNAINKNISNLLQVTYVDITPISRQGAADGTLVAADGLHPSGKMYNLWVKAMLDEVIGKVAH